MDGWNHFETMDIHTRIFNSFSPTKKATFQFNHVQSPWKGFKSWSSPKNLLRGVPRLGCRWPGTASWPLTHAIWRPWLGICLWTIIIVRSQWGRKSLPRFVCMCIYIYIWYMYIWRLTYKISWPDLVLQARSSAALVAARNLLDGKCCGLHKDPAGF
jgi:hypothetical protein